MSIKKAIIILIIIALIGAISVFLVVSNKAKVEYTTATAGLVDITQTVSETGTVKAAEEIDLRFLNTGKLAKINYAIGDNVKQGVILAELDYSDLETKKQELNASVDVARETLKKLISGATAEEVAVARANTKQAKTAYESAIREFDKVKATVAESITQAKKTFRDLTSDDDNSITAAEQSVITAQTTLSNAIATYQNSIDNYAASGLVTASDKITAANNALDAINRVVTDEDGKDQLSRRAPSYLSWTLAAYDEAKLLLASANAKLIQAEADDRQDNVLGALGEVASLLEKTFDSLNYCYSALENTVTTTSFTQSELDALKTSISAQQTIIAAALTSIEANSQNLNDAILSYNTNVSAAEDGLTAARAAYNDAVQAASNALSTAELSGAQSITAAQARVDTAREAWSVVQAQYNKIIAPANQHDLALARAKVRQAEAGTELVSNQIENSIIKASVDGIITESNYEVGEQVSFSGKPVISMLGDDNFHIEALVSEADIAKVETGDAVKIDLDAFGEEVLFSGSVYFIEPAETVIQDVIYYQVDISFDPQERPVKSGMTANVIITTAVKQNVLAVPTRAVIDKTGDGKIIRVLDKGQLIERQVTTGLRGDEGLVEIVSGLNSGEVVVTHIKSGK